MTRPVERYRAKVGQFRTYRARVNAAAAFGSLMQARLAHGVRRHQLAHYARASHRAARRDDNQEGR